MLGNSRTIYELCSLARERSLELVFLTETKTIAAKLDRLKFLLSFEGCFVVDVVGKKEGLIMLWKKADQARVLNFSIIILWLRSWKTTNMQHGNS